MGQVLRGDLMRAGTFLGRVNLEIVKAAASRRQAVGQGTGARGLASLAAAPVRLRELAEPRPEGPPARVTLAGYETAVRTLPAVLAGLDKADPRRRAADVLATSYERVAGARGSDPSGGADSRAKISDGGAVVRVHHAARVRVMEALANRWPLDPAHGPRRGSPRILLRVRSTRGNRQHIKAFDALVSVCVDGQSLRGILRRHGWSPQTANSVPLAAGILSALDDVAEGLGYGRACPRKSVDRD